MLVREQAGFRLEPASGQVVVLNDGWLDPAHLLISWEITAAAQPNATYLVDLSAGKLQRIIDNIGQPRVSIQPGGRRALLTWSDANRLPSRPTGAAVLDIDTGTVEIVVTSDQAVEQWANPSERRWPSGEKLRSIAATWVDRDTFILEMTRSDAAGNSRGRGKVLLVDSIARSIRVLAERGDLVGVFPDGSLMIRRGWMDGELLLFTADAEQTPIQVTLGGPWTDSWTISPDGQKVAWLEWDPPAGDWSDRLPHACCSGDPHPTIRDLAIYDRPSGATQRFPTTNIVWAGTAIKWRRNSDALLFTRTTFDPTNVTLYQLAADGKQTLLAQHESYELLGVGFEGADESLYYTIGRLGENVGKVFRRYPDGRLEIICEGFCNVDEQGLLYIWQDGQRSIRDAVTGAARADWLGHDPLQSPDGQWAIEGIHSSAIRIKKTK
jgi:hypothetical protein